ncbi:MAG: hypothetical protein WCF51_01730 [Nitrosomonadaceae bacterium]
MAIDSVYFVSTTGSQQINTTQKSAEDRTVEKQEGKKERVGHTVQPTEVHTTPTMVNTEGQKTGTTISTKA